jgi:hypothetical protein
LFSCRFIFLWCVLPNEKPMLYRFMSGLWTHWYLRQSLLISFTVLQIKLRLSFFFIYSLKCQLILFLLVLLAWRFVNVVKNAVNSAQTITRITVLTYNTCALSKHIGNMCMSLRNVGKGEAASPRLFPRFAPNAHIYLYASTMHMYCIYPAILNRK